MADNDKKFPPVERAGKLSSKKDGFMSQFKKPRNASTNSSADAWKAIEKVLLASVRETARARRWKIFFRFLWIAVIVYLFSVISFGYSTKGLDVSTNWGADGEHVALIRVEGVVVYDSNRLGADGIRTTPIVNALKNAYENKNAKAIILSINSPGGSAVTASDIYNEIVRLKTENPDKKIYSVIKDVGASAAYYIASATDEIYSSKNSLVGSIGVISSSFGFNRAMEELGIDRRLYTGGVNKGFLDPFSPANPEHDAFWQNLLDRLHNNFIEDVKAGRSGRLSNNPEIFSGYIYDGIRAIELGLIDGIGNTRSVAFDKTELEKIVDYTIQDNPFDILAGRIGGSFANALWEKIFTPQLQ